MLRVAMITVTVWLLSQETFGQETRRNPSVSRSDVVQTPFHMFCGNNEGPQRKEFKVIYVRVTPVLHEPATHDPGIAPMSSTEPQSSTELKTSTEPKSIEVFNVKTTETTCEPCRNGFRFFLAAEDSPNGPKTGVCYLLLPYPSPWTTAAKKCQAKGGHLLSIETENEQKHIKKSFSSSRAQKINSFCTSGQFVEGVWTWTSTGKTVNYTNWALFQPDLFNEGGTIITMQRYNLDWYCAWFSTPCIVICETEASCDPN